MKYGNIFKIMAKFKPLDFIPEAAAAALGVSSFFVKSSSTALLMRLAAVGTVGTKYIIKAFKKSPSMENKAPIVSTKYEDLKDEYVSLWESMEINKDKLKEVDAVINRINKNKARYKVVVYGTSIPWYIIAFKHFLESNMDFSKHLHNGDPLSAKTVNIPAGRPLQGNPPYTWEESAIDAIMNVAELHKVTDWSLPRMLYRAERYNGMGYRRLKRPIHTPYLWSFSNHYTKGKFVSDKKYDPNAVSKQIGFAVLLKRMAQRGFISLNA